ncbi:MAG: carbohydrate porin [Candidatus Omnitrophota bacterium]
MKFSAVASFLLVPVAALSLRCGVSYAALPPLEVSEEEAGKIEAAPGQEWLKKLDKSRQEFADRYGTYLGFLFHYDRQFIVSAKNDRGKSGEVAYWNLELLQRLWPGAFLNAELETDRGKGVDKFLPTFSVFNTNSGDNVDFYVPQLYLEQNFCSEKGLVLAGKLDTSDWFDGNAVAESADTQFLSSALVNNVSIPFPSKGLGAVLKFQPYDWAYLETAIATAEASATKTGLSDGFDGQFFITELGFSPVFGKLEGNYRFIFHLTHERLDYIDESATKNDTAGFALSFDQQVTRRISLFARYGFQNPKVRDIQYFWSFGGQLREPFAGRKYDCLGAAVAQSITGKDYRLYNGAGSASAETLWEVYYSYDFNHLLVFTPNVQIVHNPNAERALSTEIVAGIRVICAF